MIRRDFDANGDYVLNRFITQTEATVQAVETRLRLFKGEWFLNLDDGVPWFQRVLIKPARLREVESIIRRTILQTEGVERLIKFDFIFDGETRKLSVEFEARTIYGDNVEAAIGLGV